MQQPSTAPSTQPHGSAGGDDDGDGDGAGAGAEAVLSLPDAPGAAFAALMVYLYGDTLQVRPYIVPI